jgi:hypothetical protein
MKRLPGQGLKNLPNMLYVEYRLVSFDFDKLDLSKLI